MIVDISGGRRHLQSCLKLLDARKKQVKALFGLIRASPPEDAARRYKHAALKSAALWCAFTTDRYGAHIRKPANLSKFSGLNALLFT